MKLQGRRLLVCDCEKTMPLDDKALERACAAAGGEGPLKLNTQLCRAQLGNFQQALLSDPALLVACTQEAPLFSELGAEDNPQTSLAFVNIREAAGWSQDATQATPKMAALLAAAAVEPQPTPTVEYSSEGTCLVYGRDELAIEAAQQLKNRLDVTLLLTGEPDVIPPRTMDVPIFRGRIVAAQGHLGRFAITIEGHAPARPSSRLSLEFDAPAARASSECDLILDLTGDTPLFPGHEKRDGYLRPDPGDPVAVQKAIWQAGELVGEFEKPRYVRYDASICAHSRNQKSGCTRCLDVCPAGAITPAGETVAIDPWICGGCGLCSAVCPSGAATYQLPAGNTLFERLRSLLKAYRNAGGERPVLLLHDERHGAEMISMMARGGRGLPANVLPLPVNEVTQVGVDFLACALAYGCEQLCLLVAPDKREEAQALSGPASLIETVMDGLGYGAGRVHLLEDSDPDAVESFLWGLAPRTVPAAGSFLPMGGKRSLVFLGLRHLHDVAPTPAEVLALPAGSPFGRVEVDVAGCTMCLACVGACPTGALLDDPDKPWLAFQEEACVQCGLCRVTCPEQVITLTPRINFTEEARRAQELNRAEPWLCIRCGKPFAVRQSIERIMERLAGKHSMFMDSGRIERMMMCDDCRVVVEFESADAPFALGQVPVTRTTNDDLREREIEQARERLEAQRSGRGNGQDGTS